MRLILVCDLTVPGPVFGRTVSEIDNNVNVRVGLIDEECDVVTGFWEFRFLDGNLRFRDNDTC